MKDKDQHLLWEAYLEKHTPEHKKDSDHDDDEKGKYDDGDGKKEKCDFVPCKDEVQEEMDNLTFSAAGRIDQRDIERKLQRVFVDAAADWMIIDTEGLTTPEDYQGYSMSTAFDDAKDFIKDALQDLSFSDVKREVEHRGGMIMDPEEAAFQKSVDDDIKRDDSRLSDMPPREPGV